MYREIYFLKALTGNPVLFIGIFAWALAQFIKVPIFYIMYKRLHWGLWFSSGGMPSSHSALVTSVMLAIGLFEGFNTSLFAISFTLAMIVVYDAAGVRREAGRHAEKINILINELFSGHPISEKQLKEVIGHTPAQVIAGVVLGLSSAFIFYLILH
ncbi:MAG: divergent PAP2 family protein [Anaerolineaceae bacterium]|nr:divergent PAP2 family protein [Anaerolineaceae bacterium]